MAVNIDPSEVRSGPSAALKPATPRLRLPPRAVLLGGLGGVGLIAFSVGAFSFFSTLADPRARTPRPKPIAASMPDLKDGLPALVTGETTAPAKTAAFNLPRPDAGEPAAPPASPEPQQAAAPPPAEPAPVAAAASNDTGAPASRTGPAAPPIQNAATLPATRTAAIVAPPARTVAPIAPARTETVKAKPAQAATAAAAAPSREAEPLPEPATTATAVAPVSNQSARKAATATAKPPVQKTAARKPAATRTVADAEAGAAPAPASAGSDDSDIPGARQLRAGMKAIGGFFGGDAKDE